MATRKVASILDDTAELGALSSRAKQAQAVQRAFREIAPPELAQACRSSLTREGVLFIVAENGAVAAKLRQLSTRVLQGLRARGFECTGMKVEAQADRRMPPAAAVPRKRLGRDTVNLLAEAAANATPSPLQTVLARMARRHAARLEGPFQDVEQDEDDPGDHR